METFFEPTTHSVTASKRNSLLELYRFLCALWVVYYHGYFCFSCNGFFSEGYVAVEFFFLLGGFFLPRLIEKNLSESFWGGCKKVLLKAFKPLGFTFVICWMFAIAYCQITPVDSLWERFDAFGYLWYIPKMIVANLALYVLRRLIRDERIYNILLGVFALVSMGLYGYGIGYVRGIGTISLGMLLSKIPHISLGKDFDGKKTKSLKISLLAVAIALCFGLALAPQKPWWLCMILYSVGFSFLIYISAQIPVKSRVMNFLGSLSFGLYANALFV